MKICKIDNLFLEEIENYTELTYLRKSEIVYIYCRFKDLGEEVTTNLDHRYEKSQILQVFPELSYNPFVDRLFHIFSSRKDDKMSFEDILDLASAFCAQCPVHVKAKWAFLIFDFDEDQLLNKNDIVEIITRLTKLNDWEGDENFLSMEEKKKIAEIILNNIVLFNSEGITCVEFINVVQSIPEFTFAFHFKFL